MPIILLVIFLIYIAIYQLFNLPTTDELISFAQKYYSQYGYLIVFLAALAEGALFINWYFPGSFIIVLGVIINRDNPSNIISIVSLVILGFFLTSIFNYAMGRYGWYNLFMKLGLGKPLDKMRLRVEKYGLPIIFTTYFHPNLGALTATSAGILRLRFITFLFYSMLALIAWNYFWGIIVYSFSSIILNLFNMGVLLLILIGWIIILAIRFWRIKTRY